MPSVKGWQVFVAVVIVELTIWSVIGIEFQRPSPILTNETSLACQSYIMCTLDSHGCVVLQHSVVCVRNAPPGTAIRYLNNDIYVTFPNGTTIACAPPADSCVVGVG